MESPGVAPESPACHADVFLLDHDPKAEAVGVEPTSGYGRRLPSKQVPLQFGWLPYFKLRGLDSNQHDDVQSVASSPLDDPAFTFPIETPLCAKRLGEEESDLRLLVQSQTAYR